MMARAEMFSTLRCLLRRIKAHFHTIYLVDRHQWKQPGDGWASYADSYHAFSMSWTAYWMLRWAQDLTHDRKPEILRFAQAYGDFLLAQQQQSGVIPSWYIAATLKPRDEFRDFNAETAASALFLATLGSVSGDVRYTAAAERAMDFIVREVLPRQSAGSTSKPTCLARARITPSSIHGPRNIRKIISPKFRRPQPCSRSIAPRTSPNICARVQRCSITFCLQQVWNHFMFTPKLFGGFTTQNTDQEWSDARQGYAATVLADFYEATGEFEYLERAIAAARSTFAVAPWENWAHTGYSDQPGALTGFHWGAGSAMTTVEILAPRLGDAFIDLETKQGAGFDSARSVMLRPTVTSSLFGLRHPLRNADFSFAFAVCSGISVIRSAGTTMRLNLSQAINSFQKRPRSRHARGTVSMAIIAGVDFGTLSVRVTLFDSERGRLGTATCGVPSPPQARRPGLRHSIARRPDEGFGEGHARCAWRDGHKRPRGAGHRARYDRLQRGDG